MGLNRAFWKGRRVFLTGHTGFKGAWLTLWLRELGAEVVGYSLEPPTTPSLFVAAGAATGISSLTGDVRDLEALCSAMRDARPEVVIHMAAQSLVRPSYADPVSTYSTNLMGTVNVLEAVRRTQTVRAFVNVTSDKCYENREWVWGYRENEPMGGYDPYSSSKGCAELITAAYRRSFFSSGEGRCAIASARAGNVIGGGDWALDRLVPDFLRAMQASSPLVIRSPNAVRPWQFVLDPLCGYLMLVEALFARPAEFAEGWNFGPPATDERPVLWIAEHLARLWGAGASVEIDRGAQVHEAGFLKLDCTKARAQLGWRPRVTLDEALARIVSWFRAYVAGKDMSQVTIEQIREYERALES